MGPTQKALIEKLGALPKSLRATLIWIEGKEMTTHRGVSVPTGIEVYFAARHLRWE